MKNHFSLLLLIGVIFFSSIVQADSWNLPSGLDDQNTTISFEVDTTWHTVNGTTKGITGKAHLNDHNDPNSVNAEIVLPIAKFDTDSESRDEELRESMHAEVHPDVRFDVTSLKGSCTPLIVTEENPCKTIVVGTLLINGLSDQLEIPALIEKVVDDYKITGKITFNWLKFGIDDPSILVAKVDPEVTVSFTLIFKARPADLENPHVKHH